MIKDLNLLYSFYLVSKYESISKAANALYISQPAVSLAIKNLEKEIGFPLFFRKSKGVSLTTEGKQIYEITKKMFKDVDDINNTINDITSLDNGIIRIGASDTICKYYLIDILKEFEKKYPNVRYRVTNCTTSQSIKFLNEGIVDLSFVHTPFIHDNIKLYECMKLQDYFVCSYEFDDSNIKNLEDLKNYRILLLETDSFSRKMLDENLKDYNITLKPKFELASLDLLIEFCKNNMGIICVAKEYIKNELANNELKIINLKEQLRPRSISLAIHENRYLSNAAKKFIELVKEYN